MGLSVAAMIAVPGIGGILLSCLIDGTLVDMFTAIATGDWAMLGLSLLAFIPGAKAVKGLKAVGKPTDLIKPYKVISKIAGSKASRRHHLIEKRFAKTFGVKHGDIPRPSHEPL